jgi:hypothetical protein
MLTTFKNPNIKAQHCIHKGKQRCRQVRRPLCVLEQIGTVSAAVFSRNISTMVTFPLESCRIYTQLGKPWNKIDDLYRGYWTILSTQTCQALFSYFAYFTTISVMTVTYNKPMHEAVVVASLLACFITSFVKVPLVFINRNIIMCQGGNVLKDLSDIFSKLSKKVYRQCWLTIIISEIPDTFIKMFLNFVLLYCNPTIDHLSRNCIVSIVSNVITSPFDYIITHAFCKMYNGSFNILNGFDGIHYKITSTFIGQVVFFHSFNFFQPSKFY